MNRLLKAIEQGKLYSGYIICAREILDAVDCGMEIAKAVHTSPYILDEPNMESIRALQTSFVEDVQKGDAKVAIIYADNLSERCQNAMLKTIEECKNPISVIFAVTNVSVILPTIVSRCITFYVEAEDEEEIVSVIGEENRLYARYAMGSMEKAKELISDEAFKEYRDTAAKIMSELINKRVYICKKEEKEAAKSYMRYILLFLRDAMTKDVYWFFDKKDLVYSYINSFTTEQIISMIKIARDGDIKLHKNTNPMLVLDKFQLEVVEVINGNSNRGQI